MPPAPPSPPAIDRNSALLLNNTGTMVSRKTTHDSRSRELEPISIQKIAEFVGGGRNVHHTCSRRLWFRGIMYVRARQRGQMPNPFCRQHVPFVPILDSARLLPPTPSRPKRNRTGQKKQVASKSKQVRLSMNRKEREAWIRQGNLFNPPLLLSYSPAVLWK
jgi:hypothetical protein